MINVFGQPQKNASWYESAEELEVLLSKMPHNLRHSRFEESMDDADSENPKTVQEKKELGNDSIRSLSPFGHFFAKPTTSSASEKEKDINPFHKPEALDYIHKSWLPLCGSMCPYGNSRNP